MIREFEEAIVAKMDPLDFVMDFIDNFIMPNEYNFEDELDPKAMPDFVSGFMGAMTGHEHTGDYEVCYTKQDNGIGPLPTIETAVTTAISMMRKGTFFGDLVAAPMFLYFMAEMPKSLISCSQIPTISMDEIHVLTSLKGMIKPETLGRNTTITYLQKGD